MEYNHLGKTGINVSAVSLGTWQVGGGWGKRFDARHAKKILHQALDEGVNFFDTADVYDDQQSEKVVGHLVKENRNNIFIATKIGRRINPHIVANYTPDVLEKYVDEALFNTGLDELDLVQLHCPPAEIYESDQIFERLALIRDKGKVLNFGVSVETVAEAERASAYEVVSTVQVIFNMFRHKPLDSCFPLLKEKNIGILARVPLASGLLTGKYQQNTKFGADDHRQFNRNGEAFDKGETFSGVDYEQGLKAVDELKEIFDNTEHLYHYAIRWVLMHDAVSTVIPGASSPSQVKSNSQSLQLPRFSQEQMDAVRSVYDKYFRESIHELW
ncbi:MAG: aldo/keto reductase [Cyclobacteriaceae bacterium]